MKLNVTLVDGTTKKIDEGLSTNLLEVRLNISKKDNWLEGTDIDTKESVLVNKDNIANISEFKATKKEKPNNE